MSNKEDYRSNELIDRLPKHLKQFIKPQNYEDYSPINQSVWRYVMRRLLKYLTKVAHSSYLAGLEKTGVSIEEIPNMYGMNRILKGNRLGCGSCRWVYTPKCIHGIPGI